MSDAPPEAGKIVWDLQNRDEPVGVLDEEREKHRKRAERFGATFVEPSKSRGDLATEAKKERLQREGFVTGFDPFTLEEKAKRLERAQRFNTSVPIEQEYRPDEEVAAKTKRAIKFGVAYEPSTAVLMDMDLFEERQEASCDIERRAEAVYLYGVDVMSTNDVYSYFVDFGPTFVEWLNDSACNVLFADPPSAKRAMVGRGNPLPPTDDGAAAGKDPTDISNLPYLWHQGRDFLKDGTAVKLIYRMATVLDVKDALAPRNTRELWKVGATGLEGRKGKSRKNQFEQRPSDGDGAADGDVEMTKQRGPRGGARVRRRKMRVDAEGGVTTFEDVDMEDAVSGDDLMEAANVEAGKEDARPDLRTQLHRSEDLATVDMGPPAAI